MDKKKFFIVYLESSKTGNCFSDSRFTWSFISEFGASEFAKCLASLVISDYTVCVAECSSVDSIIYKD